MRESLQRHEDSGTVALSTDMNDYFFEDSYEVFRDKLIALSGGAISFAAEISIRGAGE